MTIGELMEAIRNENALLEGRYVYASGDLEVPFEIASEVLVAAPPTFNDTLDEVFPDEVLQKGLEPLCSAELITSVVQSVTQQKPQATTAELVTAFDYFMENDDFLEL